MTAPTKPRKAAAAPKPANPAPTKTPAPAPEAVPTAPAPRTGNSAYADLEVRTQVADLLEQLRDEQGLTRPFVIQHIEPDANGRAWNDSMVWRAFNRKIHGVEVDAMLAFLERVTKGGLKIDTGRARKPRIEDLQDRVTEAIQVLSNEAKTAAQYRKVVDAALEILADVVPTVPEVQDAATATDGDDATA